MVHVPEEAAAELVKGDEVRMVRHHEDAVVQDGHSTVFTRGRVAHESLRAGTSVVPDVAARGGVQGVDLIGPGHVHHTVHDHRSHLEPPGIGNGEEPTLRPATLPRWI